MRREGKTIYSFMITAIMRDNKRVTEVARVRRTIIPFPGVRRNVMKPADMVQAKSKYITEDILIKQILYHL